MHGETAGDLQIVLDRRQVVQIPRLSDLERAVGVFSGLVHSDTSTLSHRNDNHSGFLVGGRRVWRRSSGGVMRILGDSDVGDVRLQQLAGLIDLGETRLNEPLLVGIILFS